MGHCWSRAGCFSFLCFWRNGTSPSTQPTVQTADPGSDSGVNSTSQPDLNPPTSSQSSTATLFQGLGATVKDVNDLENILKFIGFELYRNKEDALDKHQKSSDGTIEIPEFISGNLEDSEKALEQISTLYEAVKSQDIAVESRTVLGDLFQGLGNLHWVTAAFSMVAFVLKRLDEMQENKKACLSILQTLQDLGRHLVGLFKTVPNEDDKFCRAATLVVKGAILCISEMDSTFMPRFTFVTASKNNISTLRDQIRDLYPDLILTITRDMHRLLSKPLKAYKAKCPENAVGLERLVDEVLEAIQQTDQQAGAQEREIKAVLLYGMGGVGKTTIAEAFCAKMTTIMSITVAKVAVGLAPDIRNCQRTIYERLSETKQRIADPLEGQDLLEDCFRKCNIPVLLYIDNVFRKQDLDNLLPRTLILPPNSYILVTSRDAEVAEGLRESGVLWTSYDVKGLQKLEGRTLLDHHLGKCLSDKEEQFNIILGLCGGWPLAIQVVGSYLATRKEDSAAWDSAIANLGDCKGVSGRVEDQMQEILRWTFRQVDARYRRVFIDIACLLRNAHWEWARTLGHGSELDTLQALSLVKMVNLHSWEDVTKDFWVFNLPERAPQDSVQVHDLLATLAQQESSSNTRISFQGGSLPNFLHDDKKEDENEDIEGLNLEGEMSISSKKLDSVHKTLRILRLGYGVYVDGKCKQIPSKLQLCSVRTFPYKDLLGLHDLRVLEIDDNSGQYDLKLDFERVQFPNRLQILQLKSVNGLRRFHAGGFENCRAALHTVRIINCHNLKGLPASICFCPLRVLVLCNNRKLEYLPVEFSHLQHLETFYLGSYMLSRGSPAETRTALPSGLANLKNLREVYIGGQSDSVDILHSSRLESLQLEYFKSSTHSQKKYYGLEKLLHLKTLRVTNWSSLQELSGDFSQLTNLTSLSLAGCKSLRELPKGIQNLHALIELDLYGCKGLHSLPDAICQFTSLQKLDLGGCTSLKEVPREFGNFPLLPELIVVNVDNLSEGLSRLPFLQGLGITDFESPEKLPLGLGDLVSLATLELIRCRSSGQLPKEFSRLTCLQNLKMTDCEALDSLPSGLDNLISLSNLEVTGCRSLSRLSHDFSKLTRLQTLTMKNCNALEELHPEFGHLLNLQDMHIGSCASLRQLPDGFGSLLALKHLYLFDAESLKHLPDTFSRLKNLGDIILQRSGLEKLPENFGEMSSLRFVDLDGCKNLKVLPNSIVRLKQLRYLSLSRSGLQALPTDIGDLGALQTLKVEDCTDLEALSQSTSQLQNLRLLDLRACKSEVQ